MRHWESNPTREIHSITGLCQKTNLNEFKKFEIISRIFSDHNAIKLEINHKKNTEKHTRKWKLNNITENEWVNNEIKEEIKRYFETNKNENTTTQKSMGHSKSSP